MKKILSMREELESLWSYQNAGSEQLVGRLREWCVKAEKSGIESLAYFARDLRGFSTEKR